MLRLRVLAAVFAISIATGAAADDAGLEQSDLAARALVTQAVTGNGATRKANEAELVKMGEAAVPALIVGAKKSAGDENRKWCEDVLDEMGKRTAADQVQTKTDDALIAVFHAFLEIHDVDTLSAVFPFTGADRVAIRNAARETILGFGDSAASRLHAEYTNLGGTLPAGTISTPELAKLYFQLRDDLRLHDTNALFDAGLALAKTNPKAAALDLDTALAREPLLERRKEAVPLYLQVALELAATDRTRAREYDLKILRIADAAAPEVNRARSQLAFFDAEDLKARGIVDRNAYARAAALDPSNEDATKALAQIDEDRAAGDRRSRNAILAMFAAFFATGLVVFGVIRVLRARTATS